MIVIQIPLTTGTIASLKAAARVQLPAIKSSHRVEALARGLGFRTYAAMIAASGVEPGRTVAPDPRPFLDYLADHGFRASERDLLLAVAYAAMVEVMAREPRLSREGMGPVPISRRADGTRPSLAEHLAEFQANRAELLGSHTLEEFLLALAFVTQIVRTRRVQSYMTSYGLKHLAEKFVCTYPGGDPLGPGYVSNGALIAAAIHAGFIHQRVVDAAGWDSPNAVFNMAKRSLDDLARHIRHSGRDAA